MSKSKPKAHTFADGGGVVTATHDIGLARELMRTAEMEALGVTTTERLTGELDYIDGEPALVVGRINPSRSAEYSWYWKTLDGTKLGTRGVTRAVVWL